MPIINQNHNIVSLPDFRNLGIILRMLLLVTAMGFTAAVIKASQPAFIISEFVEISAILQPILVSSLLALYLLSGLLSRMPYRQGIAVILFTELSITTILYFFESQLIPHTPGTLSRYWLLCLAAVAITLGYFNLRSRALSPALSEARLQALQSRIRPHFLFNSITAVLSLVRKDPHRAETVLEDMADLFRVLMADNRELTTIKDEVRLCQQYLEIEQLRLGDRLQLEWHIEKMPADALIPPLVLQPLLENAVYHGIETTSQPGTISINIYRRQNEVHIVLRNPYTKEGRHHAGNKMAVSNIIERLSLHFDAEANLLTSINNNSYQVHIIVPYKTIPKK
jgi:two-component system sensor histidine kinase AlgZ